MMNLQSCKRSKSASNYSCMLFKLNKACPLPPYMKRKLVLLCCTFNTHKNARTNVPTYFISVTRTGSISHITPVRFALIVRDITYLKILITGQPHPLVVCSNKKKKRLPWVSPQKGFIKGLYIVFVQEKLFWWNIFVCENISRVWICKWWKSFKSTLLEGVNISRLFCVWFHFTYWTEFAWNWVVIKKPKSS